MSNPLKGIPYPRTTLAALLTGPLFILFVRSDVLRKVPGFYCESFGCIGLGIIYIAIGALIPLVFAVIACLFSKTGKREHFLYALIITIMTMGLSFAGLNALNNMDIQKAMEAEEQACREYPQLCPEETSVPDASR